MSKLRNQCPSGNDCPHQRTMVDFAALSDCLPGNHGIGATDLDMVIEWRGHALIAEWKSHHAPSTRGQTIMLQAFSRQPFATVLTVRCNGPAHTAQPDVHEITLHQAFAISDGTLENRERAEARSVAGHHGDKTADASLDTLRGLLKSWGAVVSKVAGTAQAPAQPSAREAKAAADWAGGEWRLYIEGYARRAAQWHQRLR